jgi:hypothetical protein
MKMVLKDKGSNPTRSSGTHRAATGWNSSTIPIGFVVLSFFLCLSSTFTLPIRAQPTKDKWQRVYTGDESIIELNVTSLKFEADHILRVGFRTVYSKPERVEGTTGEEFKTRLETLDFKTNEQRYRLWETTLLNREGKILKSYAPGGGAWKVIRAGGLLERMFDAARSLPPFGNWKVVEYKYADRGPVNVSSTPELSRLVGTRVRLESDQAEVGRKLCSAPTYQGKKVSQLGIDLEALDLKTADAESIILKCEREGWAPSQSLLIPLKEGEMMMLWEGVFLVLKREGQSAGGLHSLKRLRPVK